jgi:DNA invertase Pin-like site-specific DNA recombinase
MRHFYIRVYQKALNIEVVIVKYFYGRSSTNRQEMSEELQLDEVKKSFGELDGTFFDRGVSGGAKIEKRIKLLELLNVLKKGDEVYIYSFSRIARDTMLHLFIEKEIDVKGATIVSVKEEDSCGTSAEKVMMRTILAAVATYEKEMIRARVKSSRATMRKNNRYMGGKREYGFRIDGDKAEALAEEQKVIESMISWKNEGMTTQGITDTLNTKSIPSATGGTWHKTSVFRVMKSATHSQC